MAQRAVEEQVAQRYFQRLSANSVKRPLITAPTTAAIPMTMKLRADGEQMYRVIFNLVRNARQAIMATGEPGEIGLKASEDDQAWQVMITDTGHGLPKKAQEHLFQPFQGGARKGGSGLGLAIAEELVRGHGGSLTLLKSDEDGTAFRITLPMGDVTVVGK